MPNLPLDEKPFPNIKPKLPLIFLHAIPSGPVTGPQREEASDCPLCRSRILMIPVGPFHLRMFRSIVEYNYHSVTIDYHMLLNFQCYVEYGVF